MKLKLQRLSRWDINKDGNIVLSGPMSPMLAAKDFIKKTVPEMVLTGLYRIVGDGEATFTTWEHADIYPNQIDVICGVLNFRHLIVFGEIGSRYMPICLSLDGEAQFSELYAEYKWISAPTVDEIANVLSTINLKELDEEFKRFRWVALAEKADDWFSGLPVEKQIDLSGGSYPAEATMWWNSLSNEERYRKYKEHGSGNNS